MDHDQAHDRGLAFDLLTMDRRRRALAAPTAAWLDRRGALKALGGLGLLAVAACGSDRSRVPAAQSGTSTSGAGGAATTAAAASEAPSGSCTAIPTATAGPFPGDGSNGPDALTRNGIVRSDITSSFGSSTTKAKGAPLTVILAIQKQASGCVPYRGAAVYLWHCDLEGRYSLYEEGVTQENYLRGVQEAGSDGTVTFKTIYPGTYSGRWPHMHFEVFESLARATAAGAELRTSQLALPEAANKLVYSTSGYERSATRMTTLSLARDGVFRDGGTLQTPSYSGDVASGLTMKLDVPV